MWQTLARNFFPRTLWTKETKTPQTFLASPVYLIAG